MLSAGGRTGMQSGHRQRGSFAVQAVALLRAEPQTTGALEVRVGFCSCERRCIAARPASASTIVTGAVTGGVVVAEMRAT